MLTKLPDEVNRKKMYNYILDDMAAEIKMYLIVKNVRAKALYQTIAKELRDQNICSSYDVFQKLLTSDDRRSIGKRSKLFSFIYNNLDVTSWYIDFLRQRAARQKKIADLMSIINNDSIKEKPKFTVNSVILKEMMNFDG